MMKNNLPPLDWLRWAGAALGVGLTIALPAATQATVGGPRELEVLGYHQESNAIFLLNHFRDESGCLPSLWRYQLDSGTLVKNSARCSSATDFEQMWETFAVALKNLKGELTPLEPNPNFQYRMEMEPLPPVTRRDEAHESSLERTFWPMQVTVTVGNRTQAITIERCTDSTIPHPVGEYRIPGTTDGVTILRAVSHCEEGGYNQDTAVFFPPPAGSEEEPTPIYTIQLMASETAVNLEPLQRQLTAQGRASYVETYPADGGRLWYRLRTGFFYLRSSAEREARALGSNLAVEPMVVEYGTGEARQIKPKAAPVAAKVAGQILLQVESQGEAWYIDPQNLKRIYLANGDVAFYLLRIKGLGITNSDLGKIPIGLEPRFALADSDRDKLPDKLEEAIGTATANPDSDNDGYTDGAEILSGYNPLGAGSLPTDKRLANRLKGRILLQVESRGEAWYVNPRDGKRYYFADGEAAYQIMRYLSVGVTNENLEQISIERRLRIERYTTEESYTEIVCTQKPYDYLIEDGEPRWEITTPGMGHLRQSIYLTNREDTRGCWTGYITHYMNDVPLGRAKSPAHVCVEPKSKEEMQAGWPGGAEPAVAVDPRLRLKYIVTEPPTREVCEPVTKYRTVERVRTIVEY